MVVEPRARDEEGVYLVAACDADLVDEGLQECFAGGGVAVRDHLGDVRLEGMQILLAERLRCLVVVGGEFVVAGLEFGEAVTTSRR